MPDDPAIEGLAKGLTDEQFAVWWSCNSHTFPPRVAATIDARDESIVTLKAKVVEEAAYRDTANVYRIRAIEDLRVALAALERARQPLEEIIGVHGHSTQDAADDCEVCDLARDATDIIDRALSKMGARE